VNVTKDLYPSADTGLFDLKVDGNTKKTDAGDGGSTGYVNVAVNSNPSVAEGAGTGTTLSDYASSIACTGDSDASSSDAGPLDVGQLAAGDVVDCTITNKRKPRLKVTKDLYPSTDGGRFDLKVNGGTQKANAGEQPGAAQVVQGPGGVIYVTGNSASGSKYYDLTAPRAGSDFGPDPLDPTGKRHYANSVENQEHVRTYVKVQARDDALVVENIRSGTCAAPNAAVEVGNVDWCGPNSGANPAQPVGSVVDKVVIHAAETLVDGGVGGTVPATLALTLGTPAAFGPFTPGIAKDYTASTTATVVSTAGDAALTASDPSTTAPGRLVNGTFSLTSPLQVAGTPLPSTVKTYAAPVSNDNVAIDFKQSIAANEALRTGTYAKSLTFTLSTTNP